MFRTINRIWAVALLTATEGLRQPSFFFLLFAANALIALSPSFALFHLGEEVKMVADLGLSTILMVSTLMALLTASATVSDEIEGRTALTMLSKPLRREEFLIGKFLGVAATAAALVLLSVPVLLLTVRGQKFGDSDDPVTQFWLKVLISAGAGLLLFGVCFVLRLALSRGLSLVTAFWAAFAVATALVFLLLPARTRAGVPLWEWRMVVGMLFIALHAWVVSAMAVALATRLTLVQSAVGTAVFFVVGHASGGLLAPFREDDGRWSMIGSILRAILPDLDQFNITDALATGFIDRPVQIPWDVVGSSTLYALLYGAALLAIGASLFSKRELA
ncbi:MAG TPA: ABC transporter permease subunit [Planctomycetota bacterium]|nr:ABC transporter permease subunit [Planctomycetota bacterium]